MERGFIKQTSWFRWTGWIKNDEEFGMADEYRCSGFSRSAVISKLRTYIRVKDAKKINFAQEEIRLRD